MTDAKLWNSKITPALIVLAALVLRLYGSDFSFSNDELSALRRLQFDGLGDLIANGVWVDGHPAFTHVLLYYWYQVAGNSEWLLRLPFVLAGTWSVLLTIRLGATWFHCQVGLFAGAALAFLCFPILYSQVARPYAFGLAFTLWFALRWGKVVFAEKARWQDVLWMAVAGALCFYTHYFSALAALVIGISGFFVVRKGTLLPYLLGALGVALLFLPHVWITLHHLSVGGVGGDGGWLGKPGSEFLPRFFLYAFNDSWWVLGACLVLGLGSFLLRFNAIEIKRVHLICLWIFAGTFAVGWGYSEWVNPVLQNSTLLFVFPFVLLALFGLLPPALNTNRFAWAAPLFLFAGVLYTTQINRFHERNHFGVFRDIAEQFKTWDYYYQSENILRIANVNHSYYLGFYFDALDYYPALAMTRLEKYEELPHFTHLIHASNRPYLALAWSTQDQFLETYAILHAAGYVAIEDKVMFNSRVTLFERRAPNVGPLPHGERISSVSLDYKWNDNRWHIADHQTVTLQEWQTEVRVDSSHVYGPYFILTGEELTAQAGNALFFGGRFHAEANGRALMAIQHIRHGASTDWHALPMEKLADESLKNDHPIYIGRKIRADVLPTDTVKAFIFHASGGAVYGDHLTIDIVDHYGFKNRYRHF